MLKVVAIKVEVICFLFFYTFSELLPLRYTCSMATNSQVFSGDNDYLLGDQFILNLAVLDQRVVACGNTFGTEATNLINTMMAIPRDEREQHQAKIRLVNEKANKCIMICNRIERIQRYKPLLKEPISFLKIIAMYMEEIKELMAQVGLE